MKISKLLVSSLLCGTLLISPTTKAGCFLGDVAKYFLIGTGICAGFSVIRAVADETGNKDFKGAVEKINNSANEAFNAVVEFGGTAAKSVSELAELGVRKVSGAIKGEKKLLKDDVEDKNLDNQIISSTPMNN